MGANWRVGDPEREAVAGQLREHYAAGRITMDEFRSRLDAAYAAPTARDLTRVTADLPGAGPARPGTHSPGASQPRASQPRASQPYRARGRRRRRRRLAALLILAALMAGSALILSSLPHGGLLLVAFLLVLVPLVLLSALAAVLVWAGRRAWRSGAWLEVVPFAAGMPWLGRVVWLARAVLVGRAFWRIGGRVRRPLRARRGYAQYQDDPGGPWHQARVGDLSGTTR
jgi:cation transport ATPase